MRVCGDQETDDEDVPVNYYEIYINKHFLNTLLNYM